MVPNDILNLPLIPLDENILHLVTATAVTTSWKNFLGTQAVLESFLSGILHKVAIISKLGTHYHVCTSSNYLSVHIDQCLFFLVKCLVNFHPHEDVEPQILLILDAALGNSCLFLNLVNTKMTSFHTISATCYMLVSDYLTYINSFH